MPYNDTEAYGSFMSQGVRNGIDNRNKGEMPVGSKDRRTYLQKRLDEGTYRPVGSEGLAIPIKQELQEPTYLQEYVTRLYPEFFTSQSR